MALKKAKNALHEIEMIRHVAQMPAGYEHGLGAWIRELSSLREHLQIDEEGADGKTD